MDKETHALIAVVHFDIAEEQHEQYLNKDGKEKTAVRCVAAQNYFYSAINVIEAMLAEKELHSFSHEDRARKIIDNSGLFSKEVIEFFDQIDRNVRNRVAYRGENGKKYDLLRKF